MREKPSLQEFCTELLHEQLSGAWCDVFNVMEGLPVMDEALVCACTGWEHYVPRPGGFTELSALVGRRGEKTSSVLKYLLYKIVFDWPQLTRAKRRRLHIPIVAQDQWIANSILRTAESLVSADRIMREQIGEILVREIVWKSGITLIVLPASKASARGLACPGGFCADEMSFVVIEGANDAELIRQIRPSMIEFGGARRLIRASTPWQSSGVMHDDFIHRAERPDVVCWHASTATMTPRIPLSELERERAADPATYEREYNAVFPRAGDCESFLVGTDIDSAVRGYRELAPRAGLNYFAAIDASGLSGGDTFVFGLGHKEGDACVVDVLRSWRKKNPGEVLDEIASVCGAFGVSAIEADQFSFSFLAELFRARNIALKQLAFSVRSKAEFFFDLKNALAQGRLVLPDNPECSRELRALVSQRTSGGGYRIAAPRGLHDDYACCLALVTNRAKRGARKFFPPVVLDVRVGRTLFSVGPQSGNLNGPFYEAPWDNWRKM